MKKIKYRDAKTAQGFIKEYIDSYFFLQPVKSTTFSDLSDCIDVQVIEISGVKGVNFNVKWVHIVFSNTKKLFQAYYMISERMM